MKLIKEEYAFWATNVIKELSSAYDTMPFDYDLYNGIVGNLFTTSTYFVDLTPIIEHLKKQISEFTLVDHYEDSECIVYSYQNDFKGISIMLPSLAHGSTEDTGSSFYIAFKNEDDFLLAKATSLFGLIK